MIFVNVVVSGLLEIVSKSKFTFGEQYWNATFKVCAGYNKKIIFLSFKMRGGGLVVNCI